MIVVHEADSFTVSFYRSDVGFLILDECHQELCILLWLSNCNSRVAHRRIALTFTIAIESRPSIVCQSV